MRHPKALGGLLALAALASSNALAQAPAGQAPAGPSERASVIGSLGGQGPFASRGGSLPPVISSLQADGVKVVSLGEEEGVRSYLAEAANGRFQTLYVAPDGEHVVAGLMFAPGGRNVTSRQIASMMRRFTAAAQAAPGLDANGLKEIPPEEPEADGDARPFTEWLASSGAKLTPFLDRDGNLDGYLAESKASEGNPSRMQPFYVFPGNKRGVAGVLIRRGNVFVTGLQVHALQQRFAQDEAAAKQAKNSEVLPGSANPPAAPRMLSPSGADAPKDAPSPGAATSETRQEKPRADAPAEPSAETMLAAVSPAAEPPPKAVEEPLAGVPAPAEVPRPTAAPAAQQAPSPVPIKPIFAQGPISTKPAESAAQYLVKAPDQEDFLAAARSTVFFTVGRKNVPAVWMVADPQCPFCHETWRQLKPLVFDGKLQVRVILIAGLRGSDPHVRSILARGTPLGSEASHAWLTGEGSINNVAIAPPPSDGTPANEEAKRFVALNDAFAQRFQISRTPFMFYTAAEKDMYASVGVPESLDGFLAALR